jgi:DNA polymerase-3 subunit alpha
MVYQEQVMAVARDFAGFTLPESDHLRKAMGKKDKEKMASYRDKFVAGAVATHGAPEALAEEIFDKIAKFAAYGFNKSHAVAYALISYQAMYLKVHYPIEFWAGTLTMVKEERHDAALTDMGRMGLKLLPPDVNLSEVSFVPVNATTMVMPFQAIKGVSERSAAAIIEARKEGTFTDLIDFEKRVPGNKCNVTQRDSLRKVGGFARIEPGEPAADDPCRRRDQILLLPGLIAESMVVDRPMEVTTTSVLSLQQLIADYKACDRCDLAGLCHPKPYIHGPTKVMLVLDAPNWMEEKADEMGNGGHADAITQALEETGLKLDDCYITALVKSPKPKGGRHNTKTLAECGVWLQEEIRILKPPVIVILGSATFKHFFPGVKGGMGEAIGKVTFDAKLDANILVGMNPSSIYFSPEKQEDLNAVMRKLAELLPV